MKEHPIPQDITGYSFHIIGNMTIKQFAELGIGVGVAVLFFLTNLAIIIKWPLMALSAGIGAAAAFVPLEGRPLDHWLIVFVSTLYKPTKFYWKRKANVPDAFTYQSKQNQTAQVNETDLNPARRQRIREYLASVRAPKIEENLSLEMQNREKEVLAIFNQQIVLQEKQAVKKMEKPNLKVRVRSLNQKQIKVKKSSAKEQLIFSKDNSPAPNTATAQNEPAPQSSLRLNSNKQSQSASSVALDLQIPKLKTVKVSQKTDAELEETQKQVSQQNQTFSSNQPSKQKSSLSATDVRRNSELPFPNKAKEANKLVGMITTQAGELINDALVEIKDQFDTTITALKSNALGQFFMNSSLPNGDYFIEVEKPGFNFPRLKISLVGETVEPLDIKSS